MRQAVMSGWSSRGNAKSHSQLAAFSALVLAQSIGAATAEETMSMKFGPENCVSLTRSKEGSCVISTNCEGVDISEIEVAFTCVDGGAKVVHSLRHVGLKLKPSAEFDTQVKCRRCEPPPQPQKPEAPVAKKAVGDMKFMKEEWPAGVVIAVAASCVVGVAISYAGFGGARLVPTTAGASMTPGDRASGHGGVNQGGGGGTGQGFNAQAAGMPAQAGGGDHALGHGNVSQGGTGGTGQGFNAQAPGMPAQAGGDRTSGNGGVSQGAIGATAQGFNAQVAEMPAQAGGDRASGHGGVNQGAGGMGQGFNAQVAGMPAQAGGDRASGNGGVSNQGAGGTGQGFNAQVAGMPAQAGGIPAQAGGFGGMGASGVPVSAAGVVGGDGAPGAVAAGRNAQAGGVSTSHSAVPVGGGIGISGQSTAAPVGGSRRPSTIAAGPPTGAARASGFTAGSAGQFGAAPGNSDGGRSGGAFAGQGYADIGFDDDLGLGVSLAEDDTLMVQLPQEDLDTIDNEMFEPLLTLDEDMREICIDIVNEKVRRILSVDPSKFKGGKLPFGLRPDKLDPDTYQRVLQLEAELEQVKSDHEDLQEEKRELLAKLELAKRGMEQLKSERGKKEPPPEPKVIVKEVPAAAQPASEPTRSRREREPPPTTGITPEDLKAAVEAAKQELGGEVMKLRQELSAAEAKLEKSNKTIAEAKEEAKENLEAAKNARKETAHERKSVLKLEEEMKQLKEEMKQQGKKPAPKQDVDFGKDAKAEMERRLSVAQTSLERSTTMLKNTLQPWQRSVQLYSALIGLKETPSSEKVESLIAKGTELGDGDVEHFEEAASTLEKWSDDVHNRVKVTLKQAEARAAAAGKDKGAPVEVEKVVEVVKSDPKDAEEIERLNKRAGKQEKEIARLLLTIDELRARLESIKDIAIEAPPEVATVIHKTMKQAGLKEIIEAKSPPILKGVFERLYQDAVQRMQRLGLIRERMLIANQAYSKIVNALVSNTGTEIGPDALPDLDRLSDTAAATLSGMWYHSEYGFRNACEYAIAQGIEAAIMKSQKMSLSEVMDSAGLENDGSPIDPGDDDPNSPNFKARRRAGGSDRLPGRRGGDRPAGKYLPGSTTGGGSHAFWHPLPGGISKEKSPRSIREGHLADPDPSSFSSYIANLRQARGDLKSDEWNRVPLPERKSVPKGDGVEFYPKTLKASVSGSRSLPVLPKGRGGMCQASPEANLGASC